MTNSCRFCGCVAHWRRVTRDLPFYFIGDGEMRRCYKADACMAKAAAEMAADEERRAA